MSPLGFSNLLKESRPLRYSTRVDNQLPPAYPGLYVPTQDERTMATLAHALQMVGGWIAPLIIFFTKRDSKFVSFHALQVLFLHLVYMCVMIVGMVIFFAVMFATIMSTAATATTGHASQPPIAIFFVFPFFWLAIMASWIVILVAAIVFAIKAGRGEWAEIPIVGGWAKRVLHL